MSASSPGLAASGPSSDDQPRLGAGRFSKHVQTELAYRLEPTCYTRNGQAVFGQPTLDYFAPQSTSRAVQVRTRMRLEKLGPTSESFRPHRAGYEFMPERDGRLLPLLSIGGAYLRALVIGHQWQVDCAWQCAALKLYGARADQ